MIRWLLRRCDYPRCWRGRKVTVTIERRRGQVTVLTAARLHLCDPHAEALGKLSMRGAERVNVYDDVTGGKVELLGFDAAARRFALEKGIPLRQARRELEHRRGL